jgi:hypothetical protein
MITSHYGYRNMFRLKCVIIRLLSSSEQKVIHYLHMGQQPLKQNEL